MQIPHFFRLRIMQVLLVTRNRKAFYLTNASAPDGFNCTAARKLSVYLAVSVSTGNGRNTWSILWGRHYERKAHYFYGWGLADISGFGVSCPGPAKGSAGRPGQELRHDAAVKRPSLGGGDQA
jgi:hypothetical protein